MTNIRKTEHVRWKSWQLSYEFDEIFELYRGISANCFTSSLMRCLSVIARQSPNVFKLINHFRAKKKTFSAVIAALQRVQGERREINIWSDAFEEENSLYYAKPWSSSWNWNCRSLTILNSLIMSKMLSLSSTFGDEVSHKLPRLMNLNCSFLDKRASNFKGGD
jgi:hypothetical protein